MKLPISVANAILVVIPIAIAFVLLVLDLSLLVHDPILVAVNSGRDAIIAIVIVIRANRLDPAVPVSAADAALAVRDDLTVRDHLTVRVVHPPPRSARLVSVDDPAIVRHTRCGRGAIGRRGLVTRRKPVDPNATHASRRTLTWRYAAVSSTSSLRHRRRRYREHGERGHKFDLSHQTSSSATDVLHPAFKADAVPSPEMERS
jgi:hypothetical protein